jgi:hypothetical protein
VVASVAGVRLKEPCRLIEGNRMYKDRGRNPSLRSFLFGGSRAWQTATLFYLTPNQIDKDGHDLIGYRMEIMCIQWFQNNQGVDDADSQIS